MTLARTGVRTPRQLAVELARLATQLRSHAMSSLGREKALEGHHAPLHALFRYFNHSLVQLDEAEFGDAYAQTVTYGLLAARWLSVRDPGSAFSRESIGEGLPSTGLGLSTLFSRLINSQFDSELTAAIQEVIDLLLDCDLSGMFEGQCDPSIHFYQDFIEAYDPGVQKKRGVYYTPPEVVAFMVEKVDVALRQDFDLPLGLADTGSWGEFAAAHKVSVPPGVDESEPFVQLLDPATGTGTFLVEVIRRIHRTMQAEYRRQKMNSADARAAWCRYVRCSLLPRINGFEVMPAPYVVAHLRLGLLLQETGFEFEQGDQVNVCLTNALRVESGGLESCSGEEPVDGGRARLGSACFGLKGRVRVIVGNPPYNDTSAHLGPEYEALVSSFRYFQGEKIREPGAIRFEHAINNDYVKFWGLSLYLLDESDWAGVVCMITPSSFLDGRSFRGVRDSLVRRFDTIEVLDLHGEGWSGPARVREAEDENVFRIRCGVAISLGLRTKKTSDLGRVRYGELLGPRETKLRALRAGDLCSPEDVSLDGRSYFSFLASRASSQDYWRSRPLSEFFLDSVDGIKTSRDALVTGNSWQDCKRRIWRFSQAEPVEQILEELKFSPGKLDLRAAQARVRCTFDPQKICKLAYRPFDYRFLYYDKTLILSHRMPTMQRVLAPGAWALVCASRLTAPGFSHLLASPTLCANKYASHDVNARMFPVVVAGDGADSGELRSNVRLELLGSLPSSSDPVIAANAFGCYVLALLCSSTYRRRYIDCVRQDFPRVPLPLEPADFAQLAGFGEKLRAAQSLADLVVAGFEVQGPIDGRLETPTWHDGVLRLNASCQVLGVSEQEWSFRCAGYPVIRSWVSAGHRAGLARKGMALTSELVQELLVVLAGVRLHLEQCTQIDAWFGDRGGWTAVFGEGS